MAMLVRQGRKSRAELDGPPCPEGLAYLWEWFLDLSRTRQIGDFGVQAITYTELAAWSGLRDYRLAPHEVDALLELDTAVRTVVMAKDAE